MTGALALAVLGLSAPTASARDLLIQTKYGYVTFKPYGEILSAGDLRENGRGVRAYLRWSRTKSASVHNPDKLYRESRNLSIPEGTKVSLTMCYTKRGLDVKCSDYKVGTA